MAKQPDERYDSARELADDLERWLKDEPIRAKRPALWQVAAKFLRRHRVAVRTAVAVAFVALMVGAGLLYQEKNRTEEKRKEAEKEKRIAEQQRDRATSNLIGSLAVLRKLLEGVEKQMTRGIILPREDQEMLATTLNFYKKFDETNQDDPLVAAESIQRTRRSAICIGCSGGRKKRWPPIRTRSN